METIVDVDLFTVADLPDSVAEKWLEELGVRELEEESYITIQQWKQLDGEMTELFIYRTSLGYHLISDPRDPYND
jgi:hypothetical protein